MRTFLLPLPLPFLATVGCAGGPGPVAGEHLEVAMPGTSLDGYTIYEVEELQNDPRAGEPDYVYLDYHEDAVRLPGPSFPVADEDRDSVFVEEDATVEPYVWGTEWWEDGLRIIVNERLHFDMKIEDFEEEVTPLAMVEMTLDEGVVETAFIMLGDGYDGVAHDIVVTAVVDEVSGESRGTYTLELRGNTTLPP